MPSPSRHAAVRRSSTAEMSVNGVVSELPVGQAGEWRTGRGAAAAHPRHALTAGRHRDARTHVGQSGPESPKPIQALLHSNASVRPRRARPAAGGTSRPRPPATRLRQRVAAEQLRGDDGARLRLLLPQRSGREVGARRDACSSSRLSHKPIRKVVRQSVVGPQCPDRPRTALLLGRSHEDR